MIRPLFTFCLAALLACTGTTTSAAPKKSRPTAEPTVRAVPRLAPDFTVPAAGNKVRSLRSFRGQPVVLLIAPSPRTRAFRKQLKELREIYSQFASRGTVFAAAFSREAEGLVQSDVPFAIAPNGPAVASAYGVNDDFNIAIIGKDGNLEYQTSKVLTAERIRDVIQNSLSVQREARR